MDLSGKRILLCDDVVTTGSTLNMCSEALLAGRSSSVKAIVAAPPYGIRSPSLRSRLLFGILAVLRVLVSEYPEKTCRVERLVTHLKMVEATVDGRKTQQRRNGLYAHPGETFELEGVQFRVTRAEHQRLGDMTEADAVCEGYPDMDTYKAIIIRMHNGMEWDEEARVWLHEFEMIESST